MLSVQLVGIQDELVAPPCLDLYLVSTSFDSKSGAVAATPKVRIMKTRSATWAAVSTTANRRVTSEVQEATASMVRMETGQAGSGGSAAKERLRAMQSITTRTRRGMASTQLRRPTGNEGGSGEVDEEGNCRQLYGRGGSEC